MSLTNRTAPSPIRAFIPPGWKLPGGKVLKDVVGEGNARFTTWFGAYRMAFADHIVWSPVTPLALIVQRRTFPGAAEYVLALNCGLSM